MPTHTKLAAADPADNASLVLARYVPPKVDLSGQQQLEDAKAALRRIAGCGCPEPYASAYERWRSGLLDSGCWVFEATLLSRMTVGLGVASANENGLCMSHTYGTPLIPGSSIKGALRAAAQEMLGLWGCGEIDPASSRQEILKTYPGAEPWLDAFGSVDGMAAITVYDAWWKPGQKPYVFETWTPHHQAYMTQGEPLPLETESPIPLSLIAVKRGETFTFAIQVPSDEWKEPLRQVVNRALERGLGAKVNQGYGRFGAISEAACQEEGREGQVARPVATEPEQAPPPEPLFFPSTLVDGVHTFDAKVDKIEGKALFLELGNGQKISGDVSRRYRVGERVKIKLKVDQGRIPERFFEQFLSK